MWGPVRRATEVDRPRIIGTITVSHGVNEFFSLVIPPVIPLLVSDLGVTYGQAGFLVTVFFVMYSLFQLPAGVVADWVGKSRLMVAGLVGMTGGILLAGVAPDYRTLLVAQAVAGVGGSTFHPTGMSLLSDVETADTEGRAMGVFGFGGIVGTMGAPLAVGGVAAVAGWRAALVGAALLGGATTLLVAYLFVTIPSGPTLSVRPDGGFALRDRLRSARDVATALATPKFGVLCAMTLVMSLQYRAIQTFTTSYVVAETGTSVSVSNVAFFTLLAGASVASLWAGELADRLTRASLGVVTALATALLLAVTTLVARATTGLPRVALVAALVVWFALLGLVLYSSYPVKNAVVSETADEAYSGSMFGVVQTVSAVGSAGGPAVFGFVATERGVGVAFPAIAGVSLLVAVLFGVLALVD